MKHFIFVFYFLLWAWKATGQAFDTSSLIVDPSHNEAITSLQHFDFNEKFQENFPKINDKNSYLEPIQQRSLHDEPIQDPVALDESSIDMDSVDDPIIDHQFWPTTQSYLYLRDKPISEVIQDFCKMQDIDVVLSEKLQNNTQKVHQSFEKAYPKNIWEQLAKTYGLLWFFDGHVLYVYESGEIETKILKIHPHQIDPLLRLTDQLGFYGSNIGVNPMKEGGIIVVSGAPKMIQIFEDATTHMEFYKTIDMDVQDIKVFPLKHAWADDKNIGNLAIPGVATMLNTILGKTVEASPTFPQSQPLNAQKIKSVKDLEKESEKNPSEEAPKIILPEGGLITTDTRQNAIIVKDYTKNLPLYENVIQKLDVPLELIEIQAAIVDVSRSCGLSLGINQLNFGNDKSSRSIKYQPFNEEAKTNKFTFSLKGIVRGNEFLTTISALESENQSKVLARPSVITMNNMAALMEHSQTVYLPLKSQKGGDLYSIKGTTQLQVTPHLIAQGDVQQIQLILDIKDETVNTGKGAEDKSDVSTSNISTQAIVYEGQSVLVGGYFKEGYNNDNSGVPVLKDIPILGHIFKHTSKAKETSERLFLITPKIIHLSASEDPYGKLFDTPSSLLKPSERIRNVTYVSKDPTSLKKNERNKQK